MNPWILHHPPITTYGMCIVVGLILAWLLARRIARKAGTDPSHIDLLVPMLVAAGIAGAYVFGFFTDSLTQIPSHGTVLIGSLIFSTVTGIVYALRVGITLGRLGDIMAAPVALGIACGRIGCFFAGCCYGKPSAMPTWMTAVRFPNGSFVFIDQFHHNLLAADANASLPVYPVQLYEALLCLLIAILLSSRMSQSKISGERFLLLGICYPVIRFALEFLRADNPTVGGGLTFSQWLSMGLLAMAVITLVLRRHYAERLHLRRVAF